MTKNDVDYSNYAINLQNSSVRFGGVDGRYTRLTVPLEELNAQVKPVVSKALWYEIVTSIRKAQASSPKEWDFDDNPIDLESVLVGDRVPVWGELISVNAESQSAVFQNEDGATELSLDLVAAVVVGLLKAGVISHEMALRFDEVITGRAHPVKPPTADDALEIILKAVRDAPDTFVEAGVWLSKITTEITSAAREDQQ